MQLESGPRLRLNLFAWLTVVIAGLVVGFRSWPFLVFEGANFDSDQALFGLMAKHIAELKHFPLFPYAQSYILALESWFAAPLFFFLPHSVFVLKFPVFVMNLICAFLLLHIARTEMNLSLPAAGIASLWFLLPAPIMSGGLTVVSGGNIEPFVFVLFAWLLRNTNWAFGIVVGIGVLNREFVLYGVVALLLMDTVSQGAFASVKKHWRKLLGMILTVVAVRLIHRFSAITVGDGPHIAAHLQPTRMLETAWWILREQVPLFLGVADRSMSTYGIRSALSEGRGLPVAWSLFVGLGAILLRSLWIGLRRHKEKFRFWASEDGFAIYLMLVAGISTASFLVFYPGNQDPTLFRHNLLFLFFPVGLYLYYLRNEKRRAGVISAVLLVTAWVLSNAAYHVELDRSFLKQPPALPHRELVRYFSNRGISVSRADYWTSYVATFIADEKIKFAVSTGARRISEYQELFAKQLQADPGGSREVFDGTCGSQGGDSVAGWCVREPAF